MKILTPIGPLWLDSDAFGLTAISYTEPQTHQTSAFTRQAKKELDNYFSGTLASFSVPLSIKVGTAFQQSVWQALLTVPYGETCSYQDIAVKVNSPKAVRAIGQANKNNPLPIIIPCHRVIGKNGALTGYSGKTDTQTLSIKEFLLHLEQQKRKLW